MENYYDTFRSDGTQDLDAYLAWCAATFGAYLYSGGSVNPGAVLATRHVPRLAALLGVSPLVCRARIVAAYLASRS